ncbi:hypothetical protein [Endozoicomonas elysicola]|uniref:hypothetical protein n=1 Tax=Endozoicomonas elysicola TaxID=305900 RepID=UPI0012FB427D|nr:hypothetical protein [Endozoicomonas elysicola]
MSHSRSYGEELQCRISVQITNTMGDLESTMSIRVYCRFVAKFSGSEIIIHKKELCDP